MALFNGSTVFGLILQNTGQYILGDFTMLGIWVLLVLIGVGVAFKLDFGLTLVLSLPVVIGFMAMGLIEPLVGGIIILLVAFMLGGYFLFNR